MLHDAVVGAELVSPWEFWRLPPGQIWWIIAHRLEQQKPKQTLTDDDRQDLLNMIHDHNAKLAETDHAPH